MFQMGQLFQTIASSIVVALIGGFVMTYLRVIGHSQEIKELQGDVAETKGKVDGLDGRLRTIENTAARIDANVAELLRVQTRDSVHNQSQFSGREGRGL